MQEAPNRSGRAETLSITTAMLLVFMPIIAGGAFFYGRAQAPDAGSTLVSQAAGARSQHDILASTPTPAPSTTAVPTATAVPLIDVLLAADILVRAGAIDAPTPEPTLIEILQAADILASAGMLETSTSPLADVMDAPAKFVGALRLRMFYAAFTPEPTLLEVLQSADVLARAGLLPPPEPPLIDVLNAAIILVDAGVIAPPPYVTPAAARTAAAAAAVVPTAVPVAPAPPPAPPPPPATPVPPPPVATPVPPPPAPPPPAPAADGWHDAQFTQQVFDGVNRRRAQSGLGPLAFEPRLTDAATTYAQVMGANRWFSHTGPDGSSMVDRITAAGFPFTVQVGEVLAMGSEGWPPEGVVQAWIDSAPHREQILDGTYTRAGAACYFSYEPQLMVRCVMNLAG